MPFDETQNSHNHNPEEDINLTASVVVVVVAGGLCDWGGGVGVGGSRGHSSEREELVRSDS